MSRLPLPTRHHSADVNTTSSYQTKSESADSPNYSAENLVIATAHLHRLKDRVRKSIASMFVLAWKRTLEPPNPMKQAMLARVGQIPDPVYLCSKTLRRASEAVELKWDVSAADILNVFEYWHHQSVLEQCSNGQAALCVNEVKPLSPAQQASEVRAAIANRMTLVIWRLQNIIEEHLCSARHRPEDFTLEEVEDGPFDNDGFAMMGPLTLTASDVLPLTQHQALVLAHRPEVMQSILKSTLHASLCQYGATMIKAYRVQKAGAHKRKVAHESQVCKRKKESFSTVSEHIMHSKADPLEVTCTESEEESSDHSAMEVEIPEENDDFSEDTYMSDRLMRHWI